MPEPDPNRLPTTVVPSHCDLELAPDLAAATFTGTAATTVEVHDGIDAIVLHALDLDIAEAWLVDDAGTRLDATVALDGDAETATLTLSGTAEPGPWTLHTRFTGELNDKLVGFYRSTFTDDDGTEHTLACTQFESTHARRAFPCWDEPAFKATYAVTLVVAEDLLAVSNSAETGVQDRGDGTKAVQFATTMAMSTYLVAFVVGPLVASEIVDVDGVPLRVIAPPGRERLTPFALDIGAFALRYLADWYDIAYPGDKVDLIAIPDFAFGAMENLGCITFRETALLLDRDRSTQAEQQRVADVVAHELAHMWFGDLVTMSWWNGIWLNEAFATFMEMMTVDAYRPDWQRWVDFGLARSAAFDTDSLSTTRPIEYEVVTAADAEGMFDVLTYEKGASVVRMLQQFLGEDRFQAGIRHYLRTHAYANTETTDLWDAIEAATGEPVRQLMDSWIFQPGHPAITVARSADGTALEISQSRFGFAPDPASGTAPASDEGRTVPVVVRVGHDDTSDGHGDETLHKVLLVEASTTIALERPATWIVANHQGNGFYRGELGDDDLATTATHALTDLHPLERYGLVEDEWALVLAGRGSFARVLGLIRSLAAETDLSVWQRVIGVLGALDRVAADHDRLALRAWTRALVAPAHHALGDQPSTGEAERTTALRAALFDARCRLGADTEQQAKALEIFEALGDDPNAVDANLADVVVRVVADEADEARWAELRRRSLAATTPQDRLRHQGALADTDHPELVARLCDLVLSEEIRTQDGLFILRRALANRHATAPVWSFIGEHWDEITTRFPSSSVPRLIDGVRSITDRDQAAVVVAFLDAHPVPQGATVIRQHVERMWVSVALTERARRELATALA